MNFRFFYYASIAAVAFFCGSTFASSTPLAELRAIREVQFMGSCDASGAVALNAHEFAVADDEDNVIRIYNADTGGSPLLQYDLSYNNLLKLERDELGRPPPAALEEMDIEAATGNAELAYWITSHGRNKKGEQVPDRLRFFATKIDRSNGHITLATPAVADLLSAMVNAPTLQHYNLRDAAAKAPKMAGGLNLEGMTAMPNGTLLLGFRNPVPAGRALLVPMTNPQAVLQGKTPSFGTALTLDLAGRGIRGISSWDNQYLLAAGHYGDVFDSTLYSWAGSNVAPQEINLALPPQFNTEAFFTPDTRSAFMLLSDDGDREINGKACKKLKNANEKYFRGLWVHKPEPVTPQSTKSKR